MQIASLKHLSPSLEGLDVPIHDAHREEECLVTADVRKRDVEHLDHPVDHASAEGSLELVLGQMVWSQLILFLDFSEVGINEAPVVAHKFSREARPRRLCGL